jgi:hypothetical protein
MDRHRFFVGVRVDARGLLQESRRFTDTRLSEKDERSVSSELGQLLRPNSVGPKGMRRVRQKPAVRKINRSFARHPKALPLERQFVSRAGCSTQRAPSQCQHFSKEFGLKESVAGSDPQRVPGGVDVGDALRQMRFADRIVKQLPTPERGNWISYDSEKSGRGHHRICAFVAPTHPAPSLHIRLETAIRLESLA